MIFFKRLITLQLITDIHNIIHFTNILQSPPIKRVTTTPIIITIIILINGKQILFIAPIYFLMESFNLTYIYFFNYNGMP